MTVFVFVVTVFTFRIYEWLAAFNQKDCHRNHRSCMPTSFYATASESVRDPRRYEVYILSRTALPQERAGEEVRVVHCERHMPISLPLGLDRGRAANIPRTASLPGTHKVDGVPVNPITQAVAPEEVPIQGEFHLLG